MNHKATILSKIAGNQEVVGIIGLGYVGLPLAVNFVGVHVSLSSVYGKTNVPERKLYAKNF